jgi:outer membrane cobalamin receptor
VAQARLFYQGLLSRNNLWLQIGVQAQSFSNFYSYNYMPVTQVFYLQDQKQTGQYLFTEFYLNARIRPVNFFIRVENALQGLVGKDYALVNGYYQPDRAFRFGVSWQFFD